MIDSTGVVHTLLVMAKTKVSPINRLSIPRLELCGACVLAKILHYVKEILKVPLSHVYAWTDSTIVLDWLVGNPRRFKTYVGNLVSKIVDRVPPDRWSHVASADTVLREVFCHQNCWNMSSGGLALIGWFWMAQVGEDHSTTPT